MLEGSDLSSVFGTLGCYVRYFELVYVPVPLRNILTVRLDIRGRDLEANGAG